MMKLINKIYLMALTLAVGFTACTDPEDLVTGNAVEGGLIAPLSGSRNYVVGNDATYDFEVTVEQGPTSISKVAVYKFFTGALGTSNEMLVTELTTTSSQPHNLVFSQDYAQLIDGLTIDGAALPAVDSELSIGDKWVFTFRSTLESGVEVESSQGINLAVSTRFAGTYLVLESLYWHPTAGDQGGWNGSTVAIESVDATTYRIMANGPFSLGQNPDNFFYFVINEDLSITIPKEYNGAVQTVWGADEVANCVDNPGNLPHANCGSTDFVVKNDVNGKDVVTMSHGYIRSSGTREFYYVLEKQP